MPQRENESGALARVATAVSDAGVNLAAATCMGSGDQVELHILVPHAEAAKHALTLSQLAVSREREDDTWVSLISTPLSGREIRALRGLRRRQVVGTRWVFVTSRGGSMTRDGFYKLLAKAATRAGIADVHPHLLRHCCGFKLVNAGMDTLSLAAYLGHANVQNTKRYARMDAARFDGLWRAPSLARISRGSSPPRPCSAAASCS